jgi:hypothetical protein
MSSQLTRRMVLHGAGGFTLAIPFLSSLLEPGAQAQSSPSGPKRFVAIGTWHGGIWQSHMYPPDAVLGQSTSYAGHAIRRGTLSLDTDGSTASLSPVLSADATRFTATLAQKMNVIRGLDVPFYLAHHRGGHLGNYADNDGNGTDGGTLQSSPRASIDQVLAWSDSFYTDLATIRERSLVIGDQGMSHAWSNPSDKEGDIFAITPENNSLTLFNQIFVPEEDPEEARAPIVDRVLEDYRRLRDTNRRLSAEDRRRLNDHLDRVAELQRKINVQVSCGEIPVPTEASTDLWGSSFGVDPEAQRRFWELINDVIVAAFSCDTCRVVAMLAGDTFSNFSGDWHQDVAHQANVSAAQHQIIADAHQRFFEGVFLDLAAKLDAAVDVNGSVLDSTLVQWTHESGVSTHDPIELPVITAGSAGGFFQTGQYVDYRNLNRPGHEGDLVNSHTGLIYNQWLGTVLQAMGLDPGEYESGSYGGYGEVMLSTEDWYAGYNKYGSAELNVMSDVLPYLRA